MIKKRDGNKGPIRGYVTQVAAVSGIQVMKLNPGNELKRIEEIFRLSYTDLSLTLRRCLEYYRLAMAGESATRNLYKVMEALVKRFAGKGVKDKREHAAKKLGLQSKEDFDYIGELSRNEERDLEHVPRPKVKNVKPTYEDEIHEGKRRARKLILAYVEWLKENG